MILGKEVGKQIVTSVPGMLLAAFDRILQETEKLREEWTVLLGGMKGKRESEILGLTGSKDATIVHL